MYVYSWPQPLPRATSVFQTATQQLKEHYFVGYILGANQQI